MARKSATKPATTPAPAASPAPAAKQVQEAPKPKSYRLTEAGAKLAPRAGTARDAAWSIVRQHADKPGGWEAARADLAKAPNLGSITPINLFGWAIKSKLVELT